MTSNDPNYHGALLSRLLWPTGILFVSTLWIVFTTILWTGDQVDEDALARQQSQISAALGRHAEFFGEEVKRALAALSAADGPLAAPRSAGAVLAHFAPMVRDYHAAFVVTPALALLGATENRVAVSPATLEERLERFRSMIESIVRGDPRPTGTPVVAGARLIAGKVRPIVLVAARLPRGTVEQTDSFLLIEKPIEDATLARMASIAHIAGLAIVTSAPAKADPVLALPNAVGEPSLYLTWTPYKPGNLVRERLVPLTIGGFCLAILLFGGVAFYLRWVTKDLAESQARSRQMIGRDHLSGLANRLLFSEKLDAELDAMASAGSGLAVLFLDLDRFKDVNDTYGHQAGDELIRAVARRIAGLLGSGDVLARFGGDEFAIIQVRCREVQQAEGIARCILDALADPFEIAHTQVTIGASIGIALAPENGSDRETLMRLADTALYQAKSEGRNRYSFFQQQMDETIRMRKVVEDDLRTAIQGNALALHYQPLFSADGERIVALEALVRWPHPIRGMINPGDFVSIAEERGLIIPLGEWVLRRACLDGQRWPGLRIAVNVSPIQFRHRNFVEVVTQILDETGFDATRLELELTEGVVVEDADAAEVAMMDLRALGVHLALDDFGTGYSSLIYLRRFAFDTIKIDRSFLESMEATGESAILVHSIVHLGRALGLTVTAEGVETREQHRFLQALGCHQLQGFLFSKPVPADEIDRLLLLHPPTVALPIATAA